MGETLVNMGETLASMGEGMCKDDQHVRGATAELG